MAPQAWSPKRSMRFRLLRGDPCPRQPVTMLPRGTLVTLLSATAILSCTVFDLSPRTATSPDVIATPSSAPTMPATSSSPPSEPTPTRLPSPLPICSQPATVGLDEMELAFVAEWDGDNEIYAIRGDGAGLRRITTNLAHEAGPVWSPDGRQIAFQVLAGANAMTFTSQLHVVMADGSGDRGLAPDLTAFGVEWSPNGEQIFVGAYDGLYSVRVDSGKATRVTRGSAGPLSPDGRLVAFAVDASPDDRTDRLFIVNIDGTGLKEVGALQDYRISGIAWR